MHVSKVPKAEEIVNQKEREKYLKLPQGLEYFPTFRVNPSSLTIGTVVRKVCLSIKAQYFLDE
jgi:hypothetical protein